MGCGLINRCHSSSLTAIPEFCGDAWARSPCLSLFGAHATPYDRHPSFRGVLRTFHYPFSTASFRYADMASIRATVRRNSRGRWIVSGERHCWLLLSPTLVTLPADFLLKSRCFAMKQSSLVVVLARAFFGRHSWYRSKAVPRLAAIRFCMFAKKTILPSKCHGMKALCFVFSFP